MEFEKCCGAVFVGGSSKRMGEPKQNLMRLQETQLSYLCRQLDFCSERYISGSGSAAPMGWTVLEDTRQNCGPMAGLERVLRAAKSEFAICVACDLPFFNGTLAEKLLQAFRGYMDCLLCRDPSGRVHPLCGIYRKRVCGSITDMLDMGDYKLMHLTERIHTEYFDTDERSVMNTNTPQEWEKAMQLLAEEQR